MRLHFNLKIVILRNESKASAAITRVRKSFIARVSYEILLYNVWEWSFYDTCVKHRFSHRVTSKSISFRQFVTDANLCYRHHSLVSLPVSIFKHFLTVKYEIAEELRFESRVCAGRVNSHSANRLLFRKNKKSFSYLDAQGNSAAPSQSSAYFILVNKFRKKKM